MKKFMFGLIVGVALSVVCFIPILNIARTDNHGRLTGRFEAAEALEKEFGRYDGRSVYKVLFSIKTTDVIPVETNGIRTVRVIP